MSQAEAFLFLKRNKSKWFTSKQISIKIDVSNATANLGKLFKHKEVLRREIRGCPGIMYEWKYRNPKEEFKEYV